MADLDDSDEFRLGASNAAGKPADLTFQMYAEMRVIRREVRQLSKRLFEGFEGAPPELAQIRAELERKADKQDLDKVKDAVDSYSRVHWKFYGGVVALMAIGQLVAQTILPEILKKIAGH
jgi:hypothetical protein